jgi:hypothetical protein
MKILYELLLFFLYDKSTLVALKSSELTYKTWSNFNIIIIILSQVSMFLLNIIFKYWYCATVQLCNCAIIIHLGSLNIHWKGWQYQKCLVKFLREQRKDRQFWDIVQLLLIWTTLITSLRTIFCKAQYSRVVIHSHFFSLKSNINP